MAQYHCEPKKNVMFSELNMICDKLFPENNRLENIVQVCMMFMLVE
jgi:hypothetical protein